MTSTIICSLLNTCQVKEWYIPMISVQPIKIHSSRFKQIRPTERVLSSFSPSKKIFISSPTPPTINTNKPADHKNYLSLDHLMTTFLPELKDDAVLCSTDSVVAFNNFSLRNDFLEFKKKPEVWTAAGTDKDFTRSHGRTRLFCLTINTGSRSCYTPCVMIFWALCLYSLPHREVSARSCW